ncbi:hypothetical protein QUB70_26230 [Microcoleus sp. A003_D6]
MFICLYLRLKKENVLTADDNGLTLIHALVENRDRNNSDARFDIVRCSIAFLGKKCDRAFSIVLGRDMKSLLK